MAETDEGWWHGASPRNKAPAARQKFPLASLGRTGHEDAQEAGVQIGVQAE